MRHGSLYHQYLRAEHAERRAGAGAKALTQNMAIIRHTSLGEDILKMKI